MGISIQFFGLQAANLRLMRFAPLATTVLIITVTKSNFLRPILSWSLVLGVTYATVWVLTGWTVATAGLVIYVLYLFLDSLLSDSAPEQKIVVGFLSLVTIVLYELAWSQSIVATIRTVFSTRSIPEFPLFRTIGVVIAIAGILSVSARERRRIRSEIREIQTQRRDTHLDRSYVSEQISVDGWSSRLEPSRLDVVPETGFLSRVRSIFGGKVQGSTRTVLEFESDPETELSRGLEEAYLRGELYLREKFSWHNIKIIYVDKTPSGTKIVVWIDSINPNTVADGLYEAIEGMENAIESANRDIICGGEKTPVSITLLRPYSKLLRWRYYRELLAIDRLDRNDSGKVEFRGTGRPKLKIKSGWGEEIDVPDQYYPISFKEAVTTIAHAFTDTSLFRTTNDVLEIWIESDERLRYEIPLRNFSLAEYSDSIELEGTLAKQTLSQSDSPPYFSSVLTIRYVCVIESRVVTFADFADAEGVGNSTKITYRISWEKREQDSDPVLTIRDVTNSLDSEENQRAKLAVVWRDN